MNTNSLLATLAGGLIFFFGGWLFWGILFEGTMQNLNSTPEGCMRGDEDMIMWAMAVGNLIWAYFFVYVYTKWASISTFKTGAIAGATICLILGLGMGLMGYSMTAGQSLEGTLLDVALNVVLGAIGGGVIGWVLGYKK